MHNQDPSYDTKILANFTRELSKSSTLIWRLFTSSEAPLWAKVIPVLSFLYWLGPADAFLIPFLGVTPIDDVLVILLGLKLFVEACPQDLVDRLRDEINYGIPADDDDNNTVIDATYHVLDDDQ